MQAAVVDIMILGLLVFLFGAVSRMRPDDRLRCWVAGWLCILAHFASQLWHPSIILGHKVQTCISMDAIALAGIFFIVSVVIQTEGRKIGLRVGAFLTISTLLCINVEIIGIRSAWPLAILVVVRVACAIAMAARVRHNRWVVAPTIISTCLIAGTWMLYGLTHGHPEVVIHALLGEIYLIAAIDFWHSGWQRSLGLKTVVSGMTAWSAVSPAIFLIDKFWPSSSLIFQIWNIPKFWVAMGMILMVMEEDARLARAFTEEYRLLFESNPHPLWIFDVESLRFLSVNQAALDRHGYTRDEFLLLKLTDILAPETTSQALLELTSPVALDSNATRYLRKDGSVISMEVTAYNTVFQGKLCRFVLAIDVTDREVLQQQLVHQTQHDILTGLPNRLLFQEQLTWSVRHTLEAEEKLAVLALDIHRFKRINDTYGPRIGDECIKCIAGMLRSHVRSMDIVARTGADEFAIVLKGFTTANIAEKLAVGLKLLFEQPLLIHGYKIQISFNMGLAVCPGDGTDAVALWRGAERALRQAQIAGGGQIVQLSPELSYTAEEQIELENYMQTQWAAGGFYLTYQPLYAFDGSVRGLEALLRLDHPKYGAVSPAKLIPIAEETGLIVQLGEWVTQEVCRQFLLWQDQGMRPVPVAINVSGLQLMHVDFAKRLMDTLQRFAVDPKWIHLEVTETAAMHDAVEVSEQMTLLSAKGIEFSIDDFGMGHSSLGRLHQLHISVLKIDRSFTNQLCVENGTYSIVEAIISMAHTLGQQVVAEGVETEEELVSLRALQCDLLQGYLLSRPVLPAQVPMLLATRHPVFTQSPELYLNA
jgi:diguanylate cyclase (GGDEF)-like protein/PAS domain S-box-containing protein